MAQALQVERDKARAERDEALAQVAVLVEALQTVRPHFEGEYHYDHQDCVTIRKALSNLPAAAKEMLEGKFQEGADTCRKNIASSLNDVLRVGALQTFMDSDIQEVNKKVRAMFLENTRLRAELERLNKYGTIVNV